MKTPISVGEILDVKVDGIGERGDPIAHFKGFAIIIKHKGLQIGDEVTVRIAKVFEKFCFAEVVKLLVVNGEPVKQGGVV